MDYQKHYNQLMKHAQERLLEGYSERHHIIPRCMGGNDDPENIAILTAEEHYIAHQLLVKIYPGESKLVYAALMMTSGSKYQSRSNKLYGWLRRKFSEEQSKRMKGVPKTAEHNKKNSEAMMGKNKGNIPWCQGKKLGPNSKESNLKRSIALMGNTNGCGGKGIPKTAEHNRKNSEANKGRLDPIVICPVCKKSGGNSGMKRWHFDNCKEFANAETC